LAYIIAYVKRKREGDAAVRQGVGEEFTLKVHGADF